MVVELPFTVPYRAIVQQPHHLRPYLVMHVTGVNKEYGPTVGIVDSGADRTSLPSPYASLMGYTPQQLVSSTITQASGTAPILVATVPSTMYVPEFPEIVIEIFPLFVPGAQFVLWGRQDFMAHFDVSFHEAAQQFSLNTPKQ